MRLNLQMNYRYMEQIEIYAGAEIISRIVVAEDTGALGECLRPYSHIYAVMDSSVAMHCPAAADIAAVLNERGVPGMLLEASEASKTMDTVMEICGWLLENGADRDALVLAVGGGIISDMTGFAASIYKRGIRFAYIPTTLLSQTDAAIGGKTGVNFLKYKNMLGVIRQPEFTYMCPQVLQSLPYRDFLSGASELLKTFVIEDEGNYGRAVAMLSDIRSEYLASRGLEPADVSFTDCQSAGSDSHDGTSALPEILERHSGELLSLVAAAARVKAGVVSRDQFENGERRKLNLGHTFAHAIETLAQKEGTDIRHGEAVAMGLILSARLSDKLAEAANSASEMQTASLEHRLKQDLAACGLPADAPYDVAMMAQAMSKDKKAQDGMVRFVIPCSIGDVRMELLRVDEVCRMLAGE